MGSVPMTDEEGRRWLNVFNPSSKDEIPAFGTVFCCGKLFDGDYDERKLPTFTDEPGQESWTSLQKYLGFGNLMMVAIQPFSGWGWNYYNHHSFYHNGPTPIQPQSWGRVTNDYPTIARVRIENTNGSTLRIGKAFYAFSPRRKSFDLVATNNGNGGIGWGWAQGIGWGGGWWNYGNRPLFSIVDIVNGFNKTEGLAWITRGITGPSENGWDIEIARYDVEQDTGQTTATVKDGDNIFALAPAFINTTDRPVRGNSVFLEDGYLSIAQPGIYSLTIDIALAGIGQQAPNDENPWSQIMFALESESEGEVKIAYKSQPAVTLAPPVIKQGYGVPSTYLSHYESAHLEYQIVVIEPEDYDPSAVDQKTLGKFRLRISRATNDEDMQVDCYGAGSLRSSGSTTDANAASKSLLVPN